MARTAAKKPARAVKRDKAAAAAPEILEPIQDPTTLSEIPVAPVYTHENLKDFDYARDLGDPGHFPFTRGINSSGYRVRTWTMRQFAGHGSAKETNERFKYLMAHGETGLSTAFDLPTLMGVDADDPRAEGEVGREGVSICSLADFEELFAGIDLNQVSTSMTINLPAPFFIAMYLTLAQKQNVPLKRIRGTCQTDILKEYIAQNEYLFPPEPSMRIVLDTIEFCVKESPRFYPISISGYHIREAGADAVQELAFTLADGREYVRRLVQRGLAVDDFAGHLSFFFDVHNDFFEEIAKLRAGRRLWARLMKDEFHARRETSMLLPMHCQTAGVSLTAQQPMNNLARVAYQALAAVLGGTQSLHTNSFDEALALPTEDAVRLALRTQQVLACEAGVTETVDPFGGSYYVESLTNEVETRAKSLMDEIDRLGGVLGALQKGFFHRQIADSAWRYERELLAKRRRVVGQNVFQAKGARPKILKIASHVEKNQVRNLKRLRAGRDNAQAEAALARLKDAARSTQNLMPAILEAVQAYATLGETVAALQSVFGEFPPFKA